MNKPRKPHWTWSVLLALVSTASFHCNAAHAFGFRDVEIQAEKLSGKPYQPATQDIPSALGALDHAQYKKLRLRDDHRIWHGTPLPWEIAPLPPGGPYQQPVTINVVDAQGVHALPFDPSSVDFGQLKLDPKSLKGLSWSGFDVLYPLNGKKSRSAVLRFQAASFFSAIGKGQARGTFARGLSIDTGLLSGEAFPAFTTFWIKRPAPGQKDLVIDALLNSKNATGAFRFVLRPGDTTTVDVEARIFLRDYVTKLGLAALTSMFDFGSNQPGPKDDYRPQVHNADGLQIHSGTGEWIWRPLVNPKRLLITSFGMSNPQGFGLMQRERDFDQYEDLRKRYDLRPSVWVTPKGDWGSGRVELVEIPTPDETNDNIVAYWVPDASLKPGQPLDFAYQVAWEKDHPTDPPSSWVTQTRRGFDNDGDHHKNIGFVVDFHGPALDHLAKDHQVDGVVTADANGKILSEHVVANDAQGGERLFIQMQRVDDSKPVELRAYLKDGNNTVSETWSYILPPK